MVRAKLVRNWLELTYVKYHNVGAGIGGGFENTNKLEPMKHQAAIHGPDGKEWKEEIKNKHKHMLKNEVFEAVEKSKLPNGAKVINSTWAFKKKSNGVFHSRLNT